ncbi:unnamed protein product [Onchocerca flexuosa]|uniref:Uncharacterized protein n=1 Tax=Onchocerca flexuosa TaxID=387005 RepID=A0A183I7W8_9BILA|nr:unnamed protein product [Onchocerca flexuosa]
MQNDENNEGRVSDLKLTVRFWKSHALNLVIASFEKTFGTFRLFAPVPEPPPLPVFPSLRTDSLPPSSFNEPHIDNDSSPGNTTWLRPYFFSGKRKEDE